MSSKKHKVEIKEIEVHYYHHSKTVLVNQNGDTFSFNPNIQEGLADFLN